jgi:hypothetical protein
MMWYHADPSVRHFLAEAPAGQGLVWPAAPS